MQRKVVLVVLAVAAIACAWILEITKVESKDVPGYETKRKAADIAAEAFTTLEAHYTAEFGELTAAQVRRDPGRTCLIGTDKDGSSYTPITNAGGSSTAKQRAINPNFAAVIAGYLEELRLSPGDLVAVALTGSYPGLSINTYAAIEAMGLRPVVITSVCGSRFGATNPEFTWLDMERVLEEKGILHVRSVAATPGGAHDKGETLTPEGLQLVWDAAERNGVAPLRVDDLDDSIRKRMQIYEREAQGRRFKAYVNVGGATPSLGIPLTEARDLRGLKSGLDRELWRKSSAWGARKGTMVLMGEEGIPVIHLGETDAIAIRYGFARHHRELKRIPEVGEGTILKAEAYSTVWAAILLILYVLLIVLLVHPRVRQRIFGRPAADSAAVTAGSRD
jgi:poly-gamma-glutamate system protein